MRGKARGADRRNEVRNQSGEGEKKTGGECMMKEGDHGCRPSIFGVQ